MGNANQIAGPSVQLACSNVSAEVELPKISGERFPSSVMIQQFGNATNVVSFNFAPGGGTIAFGDGPTTSTSGSPQVVLVAPGVNNFIRGIMIIGTATLVITPLAN